MQSRKPRILIATLGTRGDVQPYVALAGELTKLGADVTVSTGQGFEAMIENVGAKAHPVPVNFQELLQSEEIRNALFSVRGMIKAARKNLILQKEITRALWAIGLDEKPDLILFNLKATVMTFVGRRLRVPALPTALQPVTAPTAEFPIGLFGLPDLGPLLNRWSYHAGHGLMQLGTAKLVKALKSEAGKEIAMSGAHIDGFMPDGSNAPSLQAFSRALVPVPEDWTEEFWPCGYWLTDPDTNYPPPADLADFLSNGAPPTYLGFGSMPSKNPQQLTRIVLSALESTGKRAILATGWGGLSRDSLPNDLIRQIFLLEKAPHSWLFPKCAAIVHHGGSGTTHEAIRWGKPSLVTPVFGDQPFWGTCVHRIGAGPAPIKQKHLTSENLAAALKDLDNPAYLNAARKAAETMVQEPGAKGTAERLMRLLEQTDEAKISSRSDA